MQKENYEVISFYKFCPIEAIEDLRIAFKKNLIDHNLRGTIILSNEGINGTISGKIGFFEQFKNFSFQILKIKNFDVMNKSISSFIPFKRPKVKIKKEVVPIEKNLSKREGNHIKAKDWNDFISREDVILIDVRKPFEYQIGSFDGAINPMINNFREFKKYFSNDFVRKNNKKLAIFCTGGIRCEKAANHLNDLGMKEVYQLEGGILNYLDNIEEKESKWNGECYVFDQRVAVGHKSKQGSYTMCYGCRLPINDQDKQSYKYEEGVSCPKCYDTLSLDQKKRFAMRQSNMERELNK